jgi:glycosyltransferase involved in cell wall biosynthesis
MFSPLPDMALRLWSEEMAGLSQSLLSSARYDIVQVEGIEMAPYIHLSRRQDVPWIFDDHNAEYVLQRTAFEADLHEPRRWLAALYSQIQWRKLARYERSICRSASHVLTASDTDSKALTDLGVTQPISVLPNGVDTEQFVPSREVCAKPLAELGLVFAGKMDFRPNVDAMIWFTKDILPRIRSQRNLAHLTIVGQQPSARIRKLATLPGVKVTGWVPDTRPFVADAAIYVVPLRMGSGTRLKVLEAMAMGKAIVSTSLGVEGIDLQPERHAIIANTAREFADAVLTLLGDKQRRDALGQAAREQALKYDWRNILPQLDHIYGSLARLG